MSKPPTHELWPSKACWRHPRSSGVRPDGCLGRSTRSADEELPWRKNPRYRRGL